MADMEARKCRRCGKYFKTRVDSDMTMCCVEVVAPPGKVFYSGAWRTPEAVARKQEQQRRYEAKRMADPEKKSEALNPNDEATDEIDNKFFRDSAGLGDDSMPLNVPEGTEIDMNALDEIHSEDRNGNSGMTGTEISTVETKSDDETGETQVGRFGATAKNYDEERSRSMSLIDDCANQLLGCMKSVTKRIPQGDQIPDFRVLNAVANMGKQIASLAKTKLDAIKQAGQ